MSVATRYSRPLLRSTSLAALEGLDPQLLESFRAVLDGTHSLEEALGSLVLAGFEIEAIFEGLEQLEAQGLLEESPTSALGALTEGERARYAEQIAALAALAEPEQLGRAVWPEAGVAAQIRLKRAAVAIVGDGAAGGQLARHLDGAGVGHVFLVAPSDSEGEGELGLPAEVVGADGEVNAELALLVYCPSRFDSSRAARLNAGCLARSVRFLPFRQRLFDVELGPLVIPGETACYVCYETRRAALLGEAKAMLEVSVPQLAFPVGVDLLALEILKLLSQVVPPLLRGCMWRLNIVSGLLDLHPVLKLPRCPACGVHRQRPARKLWEE